MPRALRCVATLALLALAGTTHHAVAGPWTRDQGSFYVGLSYFRVAANKLYSPDFSVIPSAPYQQHVLGLYGEIGVVSWLTVVLDGVAFRYNEIEHQGATFGVGDWRVGALIPLLKKPVRLTAGLIFGVPFGDAAPSAGKEASADAQAVARSLPTGDGEWDLEIRLSLGHTFGGARRWPVHHYLFAEAGYWIRSEFHNAFVWRFELGTQLPFRVVDRLWLVWRFAGVESSASNKQAAMTATGLGDGVTYDSAGVAIFARIWRGLGASIAYDAPLRGRSLAAGGQLGIGLSYQR